MKVHLLLLILFLGVFNCQQIPDKTNLDEAQKLSIYKQWRLSNPRIFLNADEQVFRQTIFLEKLDKILQFNQDPQNSYQMSLNQFSDMTDEEFQAKIQSQKANITFDDKETEIRKLSEEADTDEIDTSKLRLILKSVDWRSKGAVTSVKNQGQCASAFAFTAAGLMESFNIIQNKSVKDFSKQQLLDCVNSRNGYHSSGCNGGYVHEAIDYATRFGILESSEYAYVAIQGQCRITSPTTNGFYPKSYRKIAPTVADLKKALDFSPVAVYVDVTNMATYSSGIFNRCNPTPSPTHAALLVGYDIFGNWIVKNEWGTAWGEAGYIRIKAGDNCGILKYAYQIMS